jgi:predicted signal transduction protein with EAL and GGDEF domain
MPKACARLCSLHFVWKGRPFMTTVSIGLVHIANTPTTLEASLRAADMACYMAKEKGRNRVQVYHADDSELSLRLAKWPGCTPAHGIGGEPLLPVFPGNRALGRSMATSGISNLLRLHDEAGRIILPDSFIPAAERYGLMTSLDRWVVENVSGSLPAACKSVRGGRWPCVRSICRHHHWR